MGPRTESQQARPFYEGGGVLQTTIKINCDYFRMRRDREDVLREKRQTASSLLDTARLK